MITEPEANKRTEWRTRPDRQRWETMFARLYIMPILMKDAEILQTANVAIANDNRLGEWSLTLYIYARKYSVMMPQLSYKAISYYSQRLYFNLESSCII